LVYLHNIVCHEIVPETYPHDTEKNRISAYLHDTEDLANLYATKLHCRSLNPHRTLMSLSIIDNRDLTTLVFYVISPTHYAIASDINKIYLHITLPNTISWDLNLPKLNYAKHYWNVLDPK
jgi:hypothetical protein